MTIGPIRPTADAKRGGELESHGRPRSLAHARALHRPLRHLFRIWGFLAWYFRGHSILQDSTGNLHEQEHGTALPPGMILWAVTITLAAVDLIMSLNPHWYSTMIGVYLFSDAVLSSLVVITLLALWCSPTACFAAS